MLIARSGQAPGNWQTAWQVVYNGNMQRDRRRAGWLRAFLWMHATGVACFYTMLWLRTRSQGIPLRAGRTKPGQHLPSVSMIVAARNEEDNIRRCVTSLLEQDYPRYDVLIVDDDSTDGTARILDELSRTHAHAARLHTLHLHALPTGWAGKPHALHVGVQQVQGDLLLFTDADTWHAPQALQTAVARMQERQLDLLSLGTTQELPGFWERVMMPLAFLGISMQYPISQVNDPRSPLALANGQYILLRRVVYEQLGGYARPDLRATLVDDRDLAVLVKRSGYTLELADGRGLVHVRMYRSLHAIWRGWRKNVYLGSRGGLPFMLLQLLGLPMVTILPFLLPLWLCLARLVTDRRRNARRGEALVISLLELGPLVAYRRWLDRELGVPWYLLLTHPLAGGLFACILAQSTWRFLTGKGVDWRGRWYVQREQLSQSGR
ncbi:MAG TPA: glycosyltransferase [Ktedonobacteraceae bacterium]|jgi:chlorobactene glucosyltransferase